MCAMGAGLFEIFVRLRVLRALVLISRTVRTLGSLIMTRGYLGRRLIKGRCRKEALPSLAMPVNAILCGRETNLRLSRSPFFTRIVRRMYSLHSLHLVCPSPRIPLLSSRNPSSQTTSPLPPQRGIRCRPTQLTPRPRSAPCCSACSPTTSPRPSCS